MNIGLMAVFALIEALNGLDDVYRFWLMDNTPYVEVIKALGFTVFEDGSIIP